MCLTPHLKIKTNALNIMLTADRDVVVKLHGHQSGWRQVQLHPRRHHASDNKNPTCRRYTILQAIEGNQLLQRLTYIAAAAINLRRLCFLRGPTR